MSESVNGDSEVHDFYALMDPIKNEICLSDESDSAKQGSAKFIRYEGINSAEMENNLYHLDEGGSSDKTSEAASSRKRIIKPGFESQQKNKRVNKDSVPENYMNFLKNPRLKSESQENANDQSQEEPSGSQEGQRMSFLKVMPVKATYSPHAVMYDCPHCEYKAPKRSLLSSHMISHSDDRPYICSMCDRGFKTNKALHVHMKVHLGHKPHACLSCESRFSKAGDLARHVRYKHTFQKRHKCSECDYATVEMSTLRRHMRAHTGERPYQCPHCTYAAPDNFKLKQHLRVHTGEKPYECDICQWRFTRSNTLKSHKLRHSDDKPVFQCKSDLRIHVQNFHFSDTPIPCETCGKGLPDRYSYRVHVKAHEDQYIDDEDETKSAENFEGYEVILGIEEAEDDLNIETLEPTTSRADNVKHSIMVQLKQEQVKENKYGIKIENESDEIDEDDESGLVV